MLIPLFGQLYFSCCFLRVFPHDISKTDAASITKRDTEMFHDKSWKTIYFESKCQRSVSRVTKTLPAWVFALL